MADEFLQQGVATTEMPYVIVAHGITFRGEQVLDIEYISLCDAMEFCAAMNLAYQNGYSVGATMMLNREKKNETLSVS
jgi:hypothetical protein